MMVENINKNNRYICVGEKKKQIYEEFYVDEIDKQKLFDKYVF